MATLPSRSSRIGASRRFRAIAGDPLGLLIPLLILVVWEAACAAGFVKGWLEARDVEAGRKRETAKPHAEN